MPTPFLLDTDTYYLLFEPKKPSYYNQFIQP